MALTQKEIDALKKQLEDLSKKYDEFLDKVATGDVSGSAAQKGLKKLNDEYKDLNQQIYRNQLQSDKSFSDINKKIKANVNEIKEYGATFDDLGASAKKSENPISNFLGSLSDGMNQGTGKMQNFQEAYEEFVGIMDPTDENFAEKNTAFWREYHRRVRDVGVEFGLSAGRLQEFKDSNLEVEKSFVNTGNEIELFRAGINSLYESTGQVNQLTPDLAANMGNMSKVLGMSTSEVGTFLGQFNNLNVSFNTTTKLLEDLRYSAEKSALNTKAVIGTFTKEFERLNTYSFKNGVNGMMDMVKQSYALKINMDSVLALSDKLIDPEQTMEFAANMQMLGGSFSQLGDFNQLMYDAAVAPEDLAKNIAKATASLGSFDRETGKFSLGFADRLQMKEAAKQLGMTEAELNKMAATAAKVKDIKMAVNVSNLTEDQMNVLGSMAQFDTGRGEYTVKVGGETKSIAELSEDDIKKISETGDKQTFQELNVSKMDAGDIAAKNLVLGEYSSLDLFKTLGGDSEKVKTSLESLSQGVVGAFDVLLKSGVFKSVEDMGAKIMDAKVPEVLNSTEGMIRFLTEALVNLKDKLKDSPLAPLFDEISSGVDNFIKNLTSSSKELGGSGVPTPSPTEKKEQGGILKGPSHMDGGIPFTINGKPGFEAEGGEVLLTKGVSQNQELLSLASKINEFAGGKKLFAEGDVLSTTNKTPDGKINVTNTIDTTPMAKSIMDQSESLESIFEEMSNTLGMSMEEIGKMLNGFSLPDFSEQKITPIIDSDYISEKIGELVSARMFSEYNKLIEDIKNSVSEGVSPSIEKLKEASELQGISDLERVIKEMPDFFKVDLFKDLDVNIEKLKNVFKTSSLNEETGKQSVVIGGERKDIEKLSKEEIEMISKGFETPMSELLKFSKENSSAIIESLRSFSESTKTKDTNIEKPNIPFNEISDAFNKFNGELKNFSEPLKTFIDKTKESTTEKPTYITTKNETNDSYKEIIDSLKNLNSFTKESGSEKLKSITSEQSITNTPVNNLNNLTSNYSNLEQLNVNKLNVNEEKSVREISNVNTSENIQNSYTQTFEKIQNEINNLSRTYTPKDKTATNLMELTETTSLKQIPKVTNEISQGQLPSRSLELPSKIEVGGSVVGSVEVKIPSFEVTLKGMGPDVTEKMEMPESFKKEIFDKINEGFSNMSMYNLSITKQGGINDGKPSNTFFPVSPLST